MKFATLIGAAAAVSTDVEMEFVKFIAQHGRSYATTEEYNFRLGVFAEKFDFIMQHNAENADDHVVGVNHFMDMTMDEYKKHLGFKKNLNTTRRVTEIVTDVAASKDWRTENAVNPVRNQGSCGSCWSFSTIAAVESAYAQQTGTLSMFSEQMLVDCDTKEDNGCNGGLMDSAFTFLETNKFVTRASYPYTAADGTCTASSADAVAMVSGFQDCKENSPASLVAGLNVGVVSVAVAAGSLGFQLYSKGILKRFCGTQLDHGIAAVGYGTENGTDYYIVRNSWGASWGESGYLRILRTAEEGKPGVCGIQMAASYVTGVTI